MGDYSSIKILETEKLKLRDCKVVVKGYQSLSELDELLFNAENAHIQGMLKYPCTATIGDYSRTINMAGDEEFFAHDAYKASGLSEAEFCKQYSSLTFSYEALVTYRFGQEYQIKEIGCTAFPYQMV